MILETRFAKSYNSVWRTLTPTMELFVRKANSRLFDRNWPNMASAAAPGSRAVINRAAFDLVAEAASASRNPGAIETFVKNIDNVIDICSSIEDAELLNGSDRKEISDLACRMSESLFKFQRSQVTLSPNYKGCGIINSCFGDAITSDDKLIELKDGDRPFRAYEFRQLAIYAALYMNETGRIPSALEVINSRRGLSVTIGIEDFSRETAGQSPYDLLSEILRIITDITIY